MRSNRATARSTRLLREILDNLKTPGRLDAHPWTRSLTVENAVRRDKRLEGRQPGEQLAMTMGGLFRELMPVTPPQAGKRLDTRWGRFGIMAANYFAPMMFGRIYPRNLREAWRRIDQAILLFVYGKTADALTPDQVRAYKLIGDEGDFAANSTISDWHRDGLQDLAACFLDHELHLSRTAGRESVVFGASGGLPRTRGSRGRLLVRGAAIIAALVLVGLLAATGLKARQIYQLAQPVRADVSSLSAINLSAPEAVDLPAAGSLLERTQSDIDALRTALAPWNWLTANLGWVPMYGGDIKQSADLLSMASDLSGAAGIACKSAVPIWQSIRGNGSTVGAAGLTAMLLDAQPGLEQSQSLLERAQEARQRIDPTLLSPMSSEWLKRADGYSSMLGEALSVGVALPRLLGASNEGPKTYLVLVQNEDELRPTGGFITAVGKLVVWQGKLIGWNIVDSYAVDDMSKAYPPAPWQMRAFMNIPIMTFRDSNWFPDFPTTVEWAEYLYAYSNAYSVNGVIAVDQHLLKSILSITGPLYVQEIDATVSADNVEQVMRAQKVPPPAQLQDPDWYRKHFMNPLSAAILSRVLSGDGLSWEKMLGAIVGELDQRHLLVQVDDPSTAKLLAEQGWDGAIRRDPGDFLMVVDTNVGYNKTNAVLSTRLAYDVDLTNPADPRSNLQVFQHNSASGQGGACNQRPGGADRSSQEFWYAIDRCYYGYLRVYVPAGSRLTTESTHGVSRDEMIMLDQDVPARVDELEAPSPGIIGFGTLGVVPIGGDLGTALGFALPTDVLQTQPDGRDSVYQLRVQKQPGTGAVAISVRVHLPSGAQIQSVSPGSFLRSGDSLLFELALKTDVVIRVQFNP